MQIVVGLNAKTDPRLAELARRGELHDLEGVSLSIPFIYHDPNSRIFVLVVPQDLAHRELIERAELLVALSKESHEIPDYVRAAESVVGIVELNERIDVGSPTARMARVAAREGEIERLRQELLQRADDLLKRDDALRAEDARLQAGQRELELGEQDLRRRLETLRRREIALADSDDDEWDEVVLDEPALSDDDLVDVDDVIPVGDLALSVQWDEDESELVHAVEEISDANIEDELFTGDFDEIEAIDDVAVVDEEHATRVIQAPSELQSEPPPDGLLTTAVSRPDDQAALPAAFFEDSDLEGLAMLDDGMWFFARLEKSRAHSFPDENTELLVQYVAVEETPVVLLALCDFSAGRPYARRAALDPRDASDRSVLEHLLESPGLTASIFTDEGDFIRTLSLSLEKRLSTLAAVLEKADRAKGDVAFEAVMERAIAAPPPVRLGGHPYGDEPPAETPRQAFEAVAALTKWSQPAKLDMALFALSIPRESIDQSFERVLNDAIRFGVALPAPLIRRAVSLGVASEPGEWVSQTMDGFLQTTSKEASEHGLTIRQIADNWDALITLANEYEASIPEQVADAAEVAIATRDGRPSEPPTSVQTDELDTLSNAALLELLSRPKSRLGASLELVSRGDADVLSDVARAVRKMPREEVLAVVPALLNHGEACADALIDGLQAKKTFVRQASALALGELGLRRGISPLIQLLQTEPTDVWEEVARALGAFGSATLRPLERAMRSPKGPPRRFSFALGHLVSRGQKIDKLTGSDNEEVSEIALAAASVKREVEAHRLAIEDADSPASMDSVRGFSRAFYRSLSGEA